MLSRPINIFASFSILILNFLVKDDFIIALRQIQILFTS